MNAGEWGAIAFGSTLALVIGLRLSQNGLMIAAFLLLLLITSIGRWLSWWMKERLTRDIPEVHVEPVRDGLWPHWRSPLALPWPMREDRRGGWSHMSDAIRRVQAPPHNG